MARRMGLITAVWLIATAISLGIAAKTSIGPVVLKLSKNHGVHAGDLAGFAGCYLTGLPQLVGTSAFDRQRSGWSG
jgi:hypothetical protein